MRDLLFVQRSTLFSTTIRLMSKCSYGRCGSFVRRCLPGLYCRVSGSVLRMPTIIRAGSSVRSISGSFDPESRIRRKGGGFLALQGGRQLFSRDSRPYHQRRQCRRSRGDRLRQCRGMRDFIMVTLGTGLGSGFVAGGRMIYGHDGMAGEWGMSLSNPEDGNAAADAVAVWKPMFLRRVPNGRPSS